MLALVPVVELRRMPGAKAAADVVVAAVPTSPTAAALAVAAARLTPSASAATTLPRLEPFCSSTRPSTSSTTLRGSTPMPTSFSPACRASSLAASTWAATAAAALARTCIASACERAPVSDVRLVSVGARDALKPGLPSAAACAGAGTPPVALDDDESTVSSVRRLSASRCSCAK